MSLRQQVFAPVEFGDLPLDLQTEFAQVCNGWAPPTDYGFVRSVIEMTDTSPSGKSWATEVTLPFTYSYVITGSRWSGAYSGASQGFSAACASAWVFPGRSEGTFAVLRSSSPDNIGGWARIQYGFDTYDDGQSAAVGLAPPTFSSCAIILEHAASSSALAPKWKPDLGDSDRCVFGTHEFFGP